LATRGQVRRVTVQRYLRELCARPEVLRCACFMEFLTPGEAVVAAEAAAAASAQAGAGRGAALPPPTRWAEPGWELVGGAWVGAMWEDAAVLEMEFGRAGGGGDGAGFQVEDDGEEPEVERGAEAVEQQQLEEAQAQAAAAAAAAETAEEETAPSLNQLVAQLTSPRQVDLSFHDTFFATYQAAKAAPSLSLSCTRCYVEPLSEQGMAVRGRVTRWPPP
jgi:hypothetical protein